MEPSNEDETKRLLDYEGLPYATSSVNDEFVLPPKECYVPQRWVLSFLLFIGLIICYALRVNLSIAIVPMAAEFGWTNTVQGFVLSSFFWGYLWLQVAGGVLSKKLGGKPLFAFAIVGASLFTAALPLCAFSFPLLLVCRIATGFCEAVSYPTVHHLVSVWIPEKERSRAVGFIWSGGYLGTIAADLISPKIVDWINWHSIFYISGISGVIWFIFWQLFSSSTPEDNKFITEHELYVIKKGISPTRGPEAVPWRRIFSEPSLWAIFINGFCTNWGFYVLLMWLPTYLKNELDFNLASSGFLAFLPYGMLFFISIGVGRLADQMIIAGISRTVVRKIFQCAGTILPGTFLALLCMYPAREVAVAIMICAVSTTGFGVAGAGANMLDVAPQHAGVILGITNTGATIPGIVGVAVTGLLLDTFHSWCLVFTIAAAIYYVGAIVWLIFATGRRVI